MDKEKRDLRTRKDSPRKRPGAVRVQRYIDSLAQGEPVSLTGQYFVDYYNERNWMCNDGHIVQDWKAMVRCWLNFRDIIARKKAARDARRKRRAERAERMRQNDQLSESRRADTERWLQEKAQHDATAVSYEEYLKMKNEK